MLLFIALEISDRRNNGDFGGYFLMRETYLFESLVESVNKVC